MPAAGLDPFLSSQPVISIHSSFLVPNGNFFQPDSQLYCQIRFHSASEEILNKVDEDKSWWASGGFHVFFLSAHLTRGLNCVLDGKRPFTVTVTTWLLYQPLPSLHVSSPQRHPPFVILSFLTPVSWALLSHFIVRVTDSERRMFWQDTELGERSKI